MTEFLSGTFLKRIKIKKETFNEFVRTILVGINFKRIEICCDMDYKPAKKDIQKTQ